jgi:polysaccharide pyruvyl transferase WcaK-like protein
LRNFDAVIVGSDQVWRPSYTDVLDGFLRFVPKNTTLKIAYSGSFGLGDLREFSQKQISKISNLIQDFSALSVRETNAIEIFERTWGIKPIKTADPVFLLRPEIFRQLYRDSSMSHANENRYLATYILDPNVSIDSHTNLLAEKLSLQVIPLKNHRTMNVASRLNDLTVERWLELFDNSDFVVTDSFHGVALSLLFNKPFLVFYNADRGGSRIESILQEFGLQSRLVGPRDAPHQYESSTFDWSEVNSKIDEIRKASQNYLKRNLSKLGNSPEIVKSEENDVKG